MPPPGIPGAALSFFGLSATMASVVIRSPAIDAAFCNAARTTLVGSMMPLVTRLTYSPFWASKPYEYWSFSRILPTMSDPSSPAPDGDLARRPGERLAHDLDAGFLVIRS